MATKIEDLRRCPVCGERTRTPEDEVEGFPCDGCLKEGRPGESGAERECWYAGCAANYL